MLLLVFPDSVLHVPIRLVDDLVVKIQLLLFALELPFLGLDLDRVKVKQLVLVLEVFKLLAKLIPLLSNLVLGLLGLLNIVLVESFSFFHLALALFD